jgi:hypothetical protein
MGYTKRKIRGINFSFLLAGFVFACWALVCAWYGWPRGFRAGSTAGFSLFALAALFFTAFPAIWARFPEKHPVNHELLRYGDLSHVSKQLDTEMAGPVETVGPFRFTATMLVYDSGHDLRLIPYKHIVSAEVGRLTSDNPDAIVVYMRSGRRYQWYSTWLQGTFDPDKVLEKISIAAHWDDPQAPAS